MPAVQLFGTSFATTAFGPTIKFFTAANIAEYFSYGFQRMWALTILPISNISRNNVRKAVLDDNPYAFFLLTTYRVNYFTTVEIFFHFIILNKSFYTIIPKIK